MPINQLINIYGQIMPPKDLLDSMIIVANKQPRTSEIEERMVILDLKIQELYGLNPVGKFIWQLIQEPCSIEEIKNQIIAKYGIEGAQCDEDVKIFINELLAANLIEFMETSGS